MNEVYARSLDTVKPLINNSKKCSDVDLNKALAVLGFGSWYALESSKLSKNALDILAYSFVINS